MSCTEIGGSSAKNQENAGESGSIAALRELSQPDQERQSIFLENKVNDFSTLT